jgi:AraC-like DNA-binding protein
MTHSSAVPVNDVHVLGALLEEMPEASLLMRATTDALQVVHEPSRHAVLARVRSGEYDAVVFPIFDGRGLPTAPLIEQCAHAHADLALFAICCAPPARAGAVLAAARAGARVVVAPSVPELGALLSELPGRSAKRAELTRESLDAVEPDALRNVLIIAVEVVVDGGDVSTFAGRLNVSPRTLSRRLHSAGLPSSRSLLAAVRLLWACAALEAAQDRDAAAAARRCGFRNVHRLLRVARQFAMPVGGDAGRPSLPRYVDALGAVVAALGGHVER